MSCSNDEIISDLDRLIKYKNSWNPLSQKPDINCDIDLQEFKKRNGITESINIDVNNLSVKELSELKEHFAMNNGTNDLNNLIKENTTEWSKIKALNEEIQRKNDELETLQRNKNTYLSSDTIDIINLKVQIKNLEEQLEKAKKGSYVYKGGRCKSKRRKSKKPTKNGKKNRKSNKKSMKK
jgi:hypothetical protein